MVCKSICKRVSVGLNSLARVLLFAGFAYAGTLSGASSFDFPGAIDTQATGITAFGAIVGRYISADGTTHGFLKVGNSFISIDFPGAVATDTTWINTEGQIVGSYNSADGRSHGYLLSDGKFTQIDYPGADSTTSFGISPSGDIVGLWSPAPGSLHGYLFSKGRFSTIDFPGALWTLPTMIVGDRIIGGISTLTSRLTGFSCKQEIFKVSTAQAIPVYFSVVSILLEK
jgi:hypothetical protein